jgi:Uncharacterised protein family (UPF0261)
LSGEASKAILVIGTYDTKADELRYLGSCIERQGGATLTMDVSVLGDPAAPVSISKHEVAAAVGASIAQVSAAGDENEAMQIMAQGASRLARKLHQDGKIDGMIAIGGTMGTDLALDCARALPLGVPKYIVSTVAPDPCRPAVGGHPDDPLGRRPLRPQCHLQVVARAGGRRRARRSTCRSAAGNRQTRRRNDESRQFMPLLHEMA